jgi:hypothetical protein
VVPFIVRKFAVPFKHRAACRHHIPKPRYRVTNWRELTVKDVDDAARTGALLDQVTDPIASFTGNGAYDRERVYEAVTERHPDAAVIVSPRSTATPSASAGTAPSRRDQHIQEIAACMAEWAGKNPAIIMFA